jgi:glycyl-radical enzyme activating protein
MSAETHKPSDETSGLVFDIQKFSIHDGPGIRTTVFVKGCLLKCLWCSNPESQLTTPQLLLRNVNCKESGKCIEVCPEEAITFVEGEGRQVDWDKCTHCLKCVDACLYGAMTTSGHERTVSEVLRIVLQDKIFYEKSKGGVTISGGEPLLQPEFTAALLKACKAEGLHTTIDSCGYAPWERLEAVLPHLDLILFDIKHLDDTEHERGTSVSNRIILENLERLKGRVAIWIRVPLISGYNDSPEHIERVAKLAAHVGAERLSLLPYHEGGLSKCGQIGKAYEIKENVEPAQEHIEHLADIIKAQGVEAFCGA